MQVLTKLLLGAGALALMSCATGAGRTGTSGSDYGTNAPRDTGSSGSSGSETTPAPENTEAAPSSSYDHTMGDTGTGSSADLKAQRRAILDDLYARYGGSEVKHKLTSGEEENEAPGEEQKESVGEEAQEDVNSAVTKADRAAFDARCNAIGNGDEPVWAGDEKAKGFFARPEVQQKCADVAWLNQRIKQQDEAGQP